MGYKDDFYNDANYIGRTGTNEEKATYYFHNKKTHEWGHVTTFHPKKFNIGREEVRIDPGYKYQLPPYVKGTPFWEYSPNYLDVRHISRNEFAKRSEANIPEMLRALERVPNEKKGPPVVRVFDNQVDEDLFNFRQILGTTVGTVPQKQPARRRTGFFWSSSPVSE